MAKFFNKKEQVMDFRLTSYGKHLLSINQFEPVYYAFYDDNIIYDGRYTTTDGKRVENQNGIIKRIKDDTSYFESFILYHDIDKEHFDESDSLDENYYEVNYTPTQEKPRPSTLVMYDSIGDAYLQGESQYAPAWKILSLQNDITSSSHSDSIRNEHIPQINIVNTYQLSIADPSSEFDEGRPSSVQAWNTQNPEDVVSLTDNFDDDKYIQLIGKEVLVYAEEINTELLNENFEIEVFEVVQDQMKQHASGSITIVAQPSNNDTITINDSKTSVAITYKTTVSDATTQVKIGTTTKDTFNNLVDTIKASTLKITPTNSEPDSLTVSLRNDYSGLVGNDTSEAGQSSMTSSNASGLPPKLRVFEGGQDGKQSLKRKLFIKEEPQIVDGFMIASRPIDVMKPDINTGSVEYYFDFLVDKQIASGPVCKAVSEFNKESYYIDIDFDCQIEKEEELYYDIYGKVTEPDICQD